ncbi:hypothetical protein [Paraburkholderia sp. J67]|uniref:hypothetical protein n=1 Tax=Paraburkholderia sp. J67 TaxID=2805435 RepID=UPI002ABDDBE7|nr:hypothetical protein [Paraburkholderia sp. J67]
MTTAARHRTGGLRRVWAIPLTLAALTAGGLAAALLGSDAGRVFAWCALATPVAVALRFAFARRG